MHVLMHREGIDAALLIKYSHGGVAVKLTPEAMYVRRQRAVELPCQNVCFLFVDSIRIRDKL